MKIVLRPFSIKGIPADRYGVELVNGSASISLGVRDAVTALGYANHVRKALCLSTGQVVELRNMQDATPAVQAAHVSSRSSARTSTSPLPGATSCMGQTVRSGITSRSSPPEAGTVKMLEPA